MLVMLFFVYQVFRVFPTLLCCCRRAGRAGGLRVGAQYVCYVDDFPRRVMAGRVAFG